MSVITLDTIKLVQKLMPNPLISIETVLGFILKVEEKKDTVALSEESILKAINFIKRLPTQSHRDYEDIFNKKIDDTFDSYVITLPQIKKDEEYTGLEDFNKKFEGVAIVKPASLTRYFDKIMEDSFVAHIDVDLTYNNLDHTFGVYPMEAVVKRADFFNKEFDHNITLLNKEFMRRAFAYYAAVPEPRPVDCWKETSQKDIFEINTEGYYIIKVGNEVNKLMQVQAEELELGFF